MYPKICGIIAMRLHAMTLARTHYVPIFCLGYSTKTDSYIRDFSLPGMYSKQRATYNYGNIEPIQYTSTQLSEEVYRNILQDFLTR